jgi:hypothetical protein
MCFEKIKPFYFFADSASLVPFFFIDFVLIFSNLLIDRLVPREMPARLGARVKVVRA